MRNFSFLKTGKKIPGTQMSCTFGPIFTFLVLSLLLSLYLLLFLNIQVILVGHDFGGACISYAMELFPTKVSKAVFIAAAMLTSGQSTLDMFSQKVCLSLL